MRGWRNWQTHYLEVVAPSRAWRFKSSPAHNNKDRLCRFLFYGGAPTQVEAWEDLKSLSHISERLCVRKWESCTDPVGIKIPLPRTSKVPKGAFCFSTGGSAGLPLRSTEPLEKCHSRHEEPNGYGYRVKEIDTGSCNNDA